jgi:hypothetical protein
MLGRSGHFHPETHSPYGFEAILGILSSTFRKILKNLYIRFWEKSLGAHTWFRKQKLKNLFLILKVEVWKTQNAKN